MSNKFNKINTADYVVVGGGLSGGYLCRALVRELARVPKDIEPQVNIANTDAKIVLVCKEDVLPYQRHELLKEMAKGGFHERAEHLPRGTPSSIDAKFLAVRASLRETQNYSWYRSNGIELLTGTDVSGIDPDCSVVLTSCGKTIQYKKAVFLSTGSVPYKLQLEQESDDDEITYLRDWESVALVSERILNKGSNSVVIVGGGVMGVELAYCLASRGVQATLVHKEYNLMKNMLSGDISDWLKQKLQDAGVVFMTTNKVVGVQKLQNQEDTKLLVTLGSGDKIHTDMVIGAIGIEPNTNPFRNALSILFGEYGEHYIAVDQSFQTSASGVYAIGDIAAIPGYLFGASKSAYNNSSWAKMSALQAAHCAVMNRYAPLHFTPTMQVRLFGPNGEADVTMKCFGVRPPDSVEVPFGDKDSEAFGVYWFQQLKENMVGSENGGNGRPQFKLCAGLLVGGVPTENDAIRHAVTQQPVVQQEDLGGGLKIAFKCLEMMGDASGHRRQSNMSTSSGSIGTVPSQILVSINGRTVDVLASLQYAFSLLSEKPLVEEDDSMGLRKENFGKLCESLDLKLSEDEEKEAILAFPNSTITFDEFQDWWLS